MILNLNKLATDYFNPVQYSLNDDKNNVLLNDLVGKRLEIKYLQEINCIKCGAKTKTSFMQGFCYNCFQKSPEASECVLKPEKCEAHLGISRDLEWSIQHCLQPHFVYLAQSDRVKVGVTRRSQIPTRWIDQGATSAIKIACTPNRYIAGCIEVDLKKHFTDKTSWQAMLKNKINEEIDLIEEKQKAYELVDDDFKDYFIEDDSITNIDYPVIKFPDKIINVNFDNESEISGVLIGIKAQYFIFDNNKVFNIRKHSGYKVELNF